MNVTNLTYTLV